MARALTVRRRAAAAAIVIAAGIALNCREVARYEDDGGGGGGTTPGITWERTAGPSGEAILALRSDFAGTVWAGTETGRLYRTVTDGDSWNAVALPTTGGAITAIVIDPLSRIFVANDVHGVYTSLDGGSSWSPFNTGLADSAVYALAYLSDGSLACGGAAGALYSARGSSGWVRLAQFTRPITSVLAISGEALYLSLWGGGAQRLSFADTTAVAINPGLPDLFINMLHAGAGGFLYAGTRGAGAYRTEPDTVFWQTVGGASLSRNVITLRTTQFGELFAGTGTGVYLSLDAGLHWSGPAAGVGIQEVRSLAVNENARIFAGTAAGVYRSVRHD